MVVLPRYLSPYIYSTVYHTIIKQKTRGPVVQDARNKPNRGGQPVQSTVSVDRRSRRTTVCTGDPPRFECERRPFESDRVHTFFILFSSFPSALCIKKILDPEPPSKLSHLLPSDHSPSQYFTSRLPAPPRLSHLKARMITSTYQNAHQARHSPSKQGSAKLDLLIGRNDSLLPHKANLPTLAPAFDNSVSGSTSALQTFLSEHRGVAE